MPTYETAGRSGALQLGAGLLALIVCGAAAPEEATPDFSAGETGWIAQSPNYQLPPSGPHHVTQDPGHPWRANGRGEAPSWRVADLTNPILQPWTRDELKKNNERILAGGTGYTRQVSCWPMGVPAFLLYPAQPVYFIQTPKEVLIIAQMDQQVRHVYLDAAHSAKVRPSWYGESIGHYEDDTLVVDTIGLNDQTWVDNFRTPHSDKLHVTERFHMIDGGKVLQVDLHVEDPGAFTTPWNAVQRYDRVNQGWLSEYICPENNLNFGSIDPMPEAKRADF